MEPCALNPGGCGAAARAAGLADGSPAEQEFEEDIADRLRENRLFRAWMNSVAAADSLREFLEPEDLPKDQAQELENQQMALGRRCQSRMFLLRQVLSEKPFEPNAY